MNGERSFETFFEGKRARVTVVEGALELRRLEQPEASERIPLGQDTEVRYMETGAIGLPSIVGAMLLALGVLWSVQGSVRLPIACVMGAAGAALVAIGLVGRVGVVRVLRPAGELVFLCRGSQRRCVRDIVGSLNEGRTGGEPKRAATVVAFWAGELRALGSSAAARRAEYRRIAREAANPEQEGRFVAARARIAAWNLLWTLAAPAVGAAGSAAVFATTGATHALVAALGAFFVLVVLGLKLLPRLQSVLAKMLS